MKCMYGVLLVLIGVTLTGFAAPAVAQIQPGRVYAGGEQIGDPELGLTLTLPSGWHGRLAPNGEWFVLESDSGGGCIVVIGDEMTEADARRQLSEPVDLGSGIVLIHRQERSAT